MNVSIHAPRGGSDSRGSEIIVRPMIVSIHAPRGGSDVEMLAIAAKKKVSIHAPRGGSDEPAFRPGAGYSSFQSTLPVGGATRDAEYLRAQGEHVSIHAPRGGSDLVMAVHAIISSVSIHAPRGGSDSDAERLRGRGRCFNPRSPWGERPRQR